MRARFREFYRDTASWVWNLLMPLMLVMAFAFIFSDESRDVFKVGVHGDIDRVSELQRFRQTRYIQFIDENELDAAVRRVERHQIDMLLDATNSPRYWINQDSANGYLLEKLLRESLLEESTAMIRREAVSGQEVRYADWLLPGVLAMNMMFSCLWGVGWVVVRYRKNGVLRRLKATPLTPFEFLTAQVLARLGIIALVTILVFAGAHLVIDVSMNGSYLALFLVLLSGAACLTSMGLIVATRLRTEEVADGLLNLMSWPMVILSGVWFSLEGAHPAAQGLAQVLPLTHIVNGARRVMIDGAGLSGVLFEVGLLSALTLFLLVLSARLFRWT
jgi:ABC-type multidrug transport system permease subunit